MPRGTLRRLTALVSAFWALSVLGAPVALADQLDSLIAAGQPSIGEQLSTQCKVCHSLAEGVSGTLGPNLWGVVDREIGSMPGYDYSDAIVSNQGRWTRRNLDRFLADPNGFAPGTKMAFVGIDDPASRAHIIAFLEIIGSQQATGEPASTDTFGSDWPSGEGRELTGHTCGACHSLSIVKQQRLRREAWEEVIDWMIEEQGLAEPATETRQTIVTYLVSNFGVD